MKEIKKFIKKVVYTKAINKQIRVNEFKFYANFLYKIIEIDKKFHKIIDIRYNINRNNTNYSFIDLFTDIYDFIVPSLKYRSYVIIVYFYPNKNKEELLFLDSAPVSLDKFIRK